MSATLNNDNLNSFLVELFRNAVAEGIYDYYRILPRWEPDYYERQNRFYTSIFIALGIQGLGPGAIIESELFKLTNLPCEINAIRYGFSSFLRVLPRPVSQLSVRSLLGKMHIFGEKNQKKVRFILSKILKFEAHITKKILKFTYGNLGYLDENDIELAENWLPQLLPNFPE